MVSRVVDAVLMVLVLLGAAGIVCLGIVSDPDMSLKARFLGLLGLVALFPFWTTMMLLSRVSDWYEARKAKKKDENA